MTVCERGRLISENLFRAVDVCGTDCRDLLQREPGEISHEPLNVGILGIAPELIIIENGSAVFVEPDRPARALPEFFAGAAVDEKRHCNSVDFGLVHFAVEFHSRRNVSPLVLPAHFQHASVFPVEDDEIVGLKQHIAEFEEGDAGFHPHFHGFRRKHSVDAEFGTDIPQKVQIFHLPEPVVIVFHDHVVFRQEAFQLFTDAFHIVCDLFLCDDGSCFAFAGRISDQSGCPADQCDRAVSGFLQTPHRHDRQKMPHVQAAAGGVKADIICHRTFGKSFFQRSLVRGLIHKSAGLQILKRTIRHFVHLCC